MKKLILIQHCQSKHHLDRSVKDNADSYNGLTGTGQKQARLVSERIKYAINSKHDFALYSSDLQRARETSEAIHNATGIEIHFDPGLREWTGDLELYGFKNCKRNSMDNFSLFDWAPFLEGPTWREFYDRVSLCMRKIEKESHAKNVIIVTHGGTMSNIVAWWLNLELDALSERNPFMGRPGGISILVKNEHNNNIIQKLNNTSHLDKQEMGI